MSIKLVNNNYELIATLFENYIYIKITNLINYNTFESNIYGYDITHEYVKTIQNLMNVIIKSFHIMNKFNINILDPDIKILNNDEYIVLKLFEQHNNIVLTIYYNMAMEFEFNITLKKIENIFL